MRRILLVGCLLLGACGLVVVPDTARLGPGELGITANPDTQAVYLAQWAFANPARTRGRPVDAARAAGAMDYIAGELNTSPRWANISILTKQQLLQGRLEVRRALGVAPGAPSQAVVDRLSEVAEALLHGDQAGALRLLGPPVFTLPPGEVLARLSDLPYFPMANVATMHASQELLPRGENWF